MGGGFGGLNWECGSVGEKGSFHGRDWRLGSHEKGGAEGV